MNIRRCLITPINVGELIAKTGYYVLYLVILLSALMVTTPTLVYAGGEGDTESPQVEELVEMPDDKGEIDHNQSPAPDQDNQQGLGAVQYRGDSGTPVDPSIESQELDEGVAEEPEGDVAISENLQPDQENNRGSSEDDEVVETQDNVADEADQAEQSVETSTEPVDARNENSKAPDFDEKANMTEDEDSVWEDEAEQTESNDTEDVLKNSVQTDVLQIVPDPYFFVSGSKYSFLPYGGNCDGLENCSISNTPIQDALDAVADGLAPDDGTLYIEGGVFEEDFVIADLVDLKLQGSANGEETTLAGDIQVVDSQKIQLRDFNFLKTIVVENSSEVTIVGTNQSDEIDVKIVGTSQIEIEAEEGDDVVTVHGSQGEVAVYGGAGDDLLKIDFILDVDPANALITYDGGDNFDVLQLTGGNFAEVSYLPKDPSSGSIQLDDARVVYTNIEPVNELSTATSAKFSGTGGADTITIADGGVVTDATNCPTGCQTIEIQSPQFENVKFANKTNVTITGSAGDDTITLNFSKLAAGLETLKVEGGESTISVTSDTDKIFVANTISMHGGDISLEAEDITVNVNQTISTRKLADGETNYETASSTGDSGDIKLNGHHIKIEEGAKLFAHVEDNSTHSAGDIEFTVYDDAGIDLSFYNRDDSSVSITIKENAVIRGSTVKLSSSVDHSRILQYTGDDQQCMLDELARFVKSLSFFAGVAYSSIKSTVEIKPSAKVFADSFTATAGGVASAQSEPAGIGISVALAFVNNVTKVIIGGQVTTTGDAYINAGVDNTALAIANTSALMGGAAAVAIHIVDSEASIHITDDATLNIGGNLTVQANTVDRIYNQATTSADDKGMLGIAVAIGDEENITSAYVDGTVTVGQDLAINAHHTTKPVQRPILIIPKEESGVNAESGLEVGDGEKKKWLDRVRLGTGTLDGVEFKPSLRGTSSAAAGVLTNFIQGAVMAFLKEKMPKQSGTPSFQMSAAVAIADDVNKTTVRVGDGNTDNDSKSGAITVGGSLTMDSTIESRPSVSAISSVEKGTDKEDIQGTKFAGSAAVTLGLFTNEAKCYINENAQVDAANNLLVRAQALNDLSLLNLGRKIKKDVANPFNFEPKYKSTDGPVKVGADEIVKVEKGHTAGGIVGDLYQYVGTSPNSIIDLEKEDFVNPGNWKHLGSPTYHIATQFVGNIYGYLNDDIAGIFSDSVTQAVAKDGETMAMAFAVSVLDLDHDTQAYIADNAKINQNTAIRSLQQHVEVKANNVNELLKFIGNIQLPTVGLDIAAFEFSPSKGGFGTSSGKGAIGVVVLVIDYDNDVLAKIGDGVKLYADSLYVDADSKTLSILIGASGGEAGKVGFNGVVFVQNVDNKIYAHIENGATVSVGVQKVAEIWGTAQGGSSNKIKLASDASIFDDKYKGMYVEFTAPDYTTYVRKITGYDGTSKEATIESAPSAPTLNTPYRVLNLSGASLLVSANDKTDLATLAGGVAVSKNIGIGASVTIQNLTRDTQAIIGNRVNDAAETDAATGSISSKGLAKIEAENGGFFGGFSLAAAVKKKSTTIEANDPLDGASLSSLFGETPSQDMAGKSGAGIAGDVAIKTVTDSTQAYIRDAGPITANNYEVLLDAQNESRFVSIAGAVAISISDPGKKSAGIAGSFALNTITYTTEAFVINTTITADKLTLDVDNGGWAVAASGGGSGATGKDGIAIAGSVSLNTINHTTRANLESSTVTLTGALEQTATNSSSMVAVGGTLSIGGKVGLGASIALNKINDTTEAKMISSTVSAGGTASVKADNSSRIIAITVSVGASQSTGAAGTISINIIDNDTSAWIKNSTITGSTSAVSTLAQDVASIYSFAGAVGIGLKKAGFGAAFAWNEIESDIQASVENSTVNTASLSVRAEMKDAEIWTLSVGAAGAKKLAIAGSVSVNAIYNTIDAHISNASDIDTAGDVSVIAQDDSSIKSLAGQVAISLQSSSDGAAVGVNMIDNTVKAYVDNSNVDTISAGNLIVKADETATIHSISAGGTGAKGFTLGGSVSVNLPDIIVQAYISGSKPIVVDGSVLISASDEMDTWTLAGNVSISLKSPAVGISNVTLVTDNTVEAYVDENVILQSRGNDSGLDVYTGLKKDDERTTEKINGLAVVAVSFEDFDSFAVGGSGGGGIGIAGSATVSVLDETTKATIKHGAQVNGGTNSGASNNQGVIVRASDDTYLMGLAGGVGISLKSGGVGAGIDVAVINKVTEAAIQAGSKVNAKRDVIVDANSREEVSSISGSVGAGKSAGIAGSVGISVYDLETIAVIEGDNNNLDGAIVKAEGSVLVAAADDTELDHIAGGVAAGKDAGISAAIGIPILSKTVKAYIGKGGAVDALAMRTHGIAAKSGEFVITDIPDPMGVIDSLTDGKVPSLTSTGYGDNKSMTSKRIASPTKVTGFKGVAVSAVNQDDIAMLSVGVGAAGKGVAIQFSTAINVMGIDTLAYIDDEALVNQAAGATKDQSVLVAAGNDYVVKGYVGGVSAAGKGTAISPGVFDGVVDPTTKAYIGKNAKVSAKADIIISAFAGEEILSVTIAIAGTGMGAGIVGAIMVIDLDAVTYAYINGGAAVKADGNIRLSATDKTEVDAIIGSLGIAGKGAGIGVSIGVSSIDKDTRALIANNAKVTALGTSAANQKAYNGDFDTSGALKKNGDVHGLVVEAYSSEDIWTLLIAGAAGIIGAGVSGSIDVIGVDSDTLAYIDGSATINTDNTGAGDKQDIYITAVNDFTLYNILGVLGIGAGGIAGAVDVLTQRNDTTAYFSGTANARRDVHVNALAVRDIETIVISVGAGIGGVAGSIGVYTLGGNLESTYQSGSETSNSLNDKDGNSVTGQADSDAANTKNSTMLSAFSDPNNDPSTQNTDKVQSTTSTVDSKVKSDVSSNVVGGKLSEDAVNATRLFPRGTSAFVTDGSTIIAGRHVDIDAREKIDLQTKLGGVGAGAVGVGVGLAIVNSTTPVTAFIGSDSVISAGTVVSSGVISVEAELDADYDVTSFVGT